MKQVFLALCIGGFCVAFGHSSLAAPKALAIATPEGGQVADAEVDQNGTVHVAYVLGENAFYAQTRDGGAEFTKPLRINTETNSVHPANMFRGPDLAIGKNGRIHVIWFSNSYQRKLPQDKWGVFYSHWDPGQSAFAESANLNHKPSDNYSLGANTNGDVAVVWMAGKLYVTSSHDNGESFPLTESVTNANPCECCASRALFRERALYIDYRDKTDNIRDMHLLLRLPGQETFSNLKISSEPWPITGCPMTGTFLQNSGRGTIMSWETKGRILYARIDSSPSATPKEVTASEKGKWPIALASPDGTVLASWKTGSTLHWQLFDSKDQPLGLAQQKPSPNANRHAAIVQPNGDFLLID